MKILAYERTPQEWPQELQRCLDCEEQSATLPIANTLIADSAMVRHGMPMFVPDFARSGRLQLWVAIIVDRLGKWIAPRFGHRYYATAALAVRLVPECGLGYSNALACGFDGAIYLGTPFDASLLAESLQITFGYEATEPDKVTVDGSCLHDADLLALTSRFMTVKTGDTLLLAKLSSLAEVKLNTCVIATINGTEVLRLKLK